MRIGIDISQIVFEGTGISTYTRSLVKNLLKIGREYEFVLFGSSFRRKQQFVEYWQSLENKQKTLTRFLPLPPLFWEYIWNKFHILPIEKIIGNVDVFHSSDWTEPPFAFPKVTTIHDLIVYKFPNETHGRIKYNQLKRMYWAKKESNMIIADSYATKNDIVEILKIPESKIRVIHLAPREEFKRENLVLKAESVREKYGLNKPYFLSVGTREPRKNLAKSISAYNHFSRKNEVDYTIVGKFGWGEDVKPIPGVKVLGFIPNEELAILYQEALAFIFPSLYEGFGLPVLEAQNMGCPVISSDRGSLKEVLCNKAIVIDPDKEEDITNALEEIYSKFEKDKYFEMVKSGLEFAKQFSWGKTAKETLNVYEEVIGSG